MKKTSAKKKRRWLIVTPTFIALLVAVFFAYVSVYYRADETAREALVSDSEVKVIETEYGYLFDGSSESDALIFYPGGKVEETAYAPLLHEIARHGVDVCLVKMPFRLAVFDENKADDVIAQTDYDRYFIGGHSLGGNIASSYAADSSDISGVVLLASYSSRAIPENIAVLSVYGTNDGVLSKVSYEKNLRNVSGSLTEVVIDGGNHAYFGSYGEQRGDGDAEITPAQQQEQTRGAIAEFVAKE